MPDLAVRFADFKGGHPGDADPSRWAGDQWTGENIAYYRTGLIGPRPGLRGMRVGNLGTIPTIGGPFGFATFGKHGFIVTDVLRRFDASVVSDQAAVAYPAYPATPTTYVSMVMDPDGVLFTCASGVVYRHGKTTDALATAVVTTPPPPLSFIAQWGLYCFGVDRDKPSRLWFTQVDENGFDWSAWPANNYIDIGGYDPIVALVPGIATLYVGKTSGWHALSGVPGIQAYVRLVTRGNGPVSGRGCTMRSDGRIAYWTGGGHPAQFDGGGTRVFADHTVERYRAQAAQAVVAAPFVPMIVYGWDRPDGSSAMTVDGGRWVRHHFEDVFFAGFAPDQPDRAGVELPDDVVLVARQAQRVGEPAQIMWWAHDADAPGRADDLFGRPGDLTDVPLEAHVELPAWYDGQGRQVRVRTVIVQLRKFDIGVARILNRLGVQVRSLGAYDAGTVEGEVNWWLEDTQLAEAEGVDHSVRINIGEQGWGNGFQIVLQGLVGVAIREVTALVDMGGART